MCDANRCSRSAPAARKLQDAASDPTEGLKRRKDEGRIVSTEDDASKRLLELIYRGMFTWLRGLRVHVPHVMGHTDLAMTKRYQAYTLGGIKEQHAHASPVNILVPARKKVGKVKR